MKSQSAAAFRFVSRTFPLAAGLLAMGAARRPPSLPDVGLFAALRWRNIGPFRAGRVTAVTGAVGQPGVFYMGLPIGGVWKTTSEGVNSFPVYDSIKEESSIGAVEVAPSDPNIIYVGTGSVNEGNGVYKSTDAGKTWQHLGMERTRAIPTMVVDPRNPDLVVMGVLGSNRTADDNRGVFRSTDGGKNWTRTLFVDSTTGVQQLASAYDRPDIMLASTIRRFGARGGGGGAAGAGGRGGRGGAGGPPAFNGTSLYKSTDEGLTWKEISGNGLPALSGRLSLAVAMHTNGQRMFVIGPANFGLYRSDDGGSTWRHMALNDPRIANGQGNYTSGVYVNTSNPDIVYTLATCTFVSTNGGVTFTGYKCAPGGDDPQVMWLDPTDSKRQLLGFDQGATISQDGGATWSLWYNQPTAQVYHISVDNSYPYWVYASQQDACAVQVRSRGDLGEVTFLDWFPTPGYENGSIVTDPLNNNIVYSLGSTAGIVKITYPSGQWINVSPNVDTSLGLRRFGDQPMQFNQSNPHELFVGFQYLMNTFDGGVTWHEISPDLGVPKGMTPPARGAPPLAGGGGAAGTIESISSSSLSPSLIWAGTSNGLIHVTRNHGATWEDVSIPEVRGAISAIDASHLDPATAYVALRVPGSFAPDFYRTHDYGRTWTKIINGMRTDQPSGSFARVIRADTKKAGLLFAGTESSMYVSFDDGDNWQSLMLNLPNTSYRDIVVKDNDLVVGTYGRSIWILDDMSALRQMAPGIASEPVHLFKPGDAVRVRRNINAGTPFPPEVPHGINPPMGVAIDYYIGKPPTGPMTLEILDARGSVVRHMSSLPVPAPTDELPVVPDWWIDLPKPLPTGAGSHRITWDLRYDDPPAFLHYIAHVTGATPGETPYSPNGPLALPGVYTLKLTADGRSYTQTVTVKNDPRSPATAAGLQAQHNLQMGLYAANQEAWDGFQQVAAMRDAVAALRKDHPSAAVDSVVAAFDAKLAAVGGTVSATGGRGGRGSGPPPVPNFAALSGYETEESMVLTSLNGQLKTLDFGDMAPNPAKYHAWAMACQDLKRAVATWQAINTRDVPELNALLTRNNLKPIAAVPPLATPACIPAYPLVWKRLKAP
jgi:photosystem II stability/assembly factor-like uncharacterized protein